VDCIAEQLIELRSPQLWWSLFDSILSGRPNQISVICVGRQQKLFFFFQLHTVVKLFFNDLTIFKTTHRYQLQTTSGDVR